MSTQAGLHIEAARSDHLRSITSLAGSFRLNRSKHKGLATRLYLRLFRQSKGRAIFATVVLDPPNSRSVRLHEKLGLKRFRS